MATSSLSSLRILFQDSWELFKKTILLYWKVTVVGFIAIILFATLTGLLGIPLVRNVIQATHYPTPFEIGTVIFFAVVTLIPLVGLVAACFLWSIASTLILKNYQTASIKSLTTQSRPFIAPYFITNLLVVFFILGGYFILVLPGIVMSIFFLFTDYEIIFEKQKGMAALKRSYVLVKSNFWGILGRLIIVEIIIYILQFILGKIAGQNGLMVFVVMLINIAMGWYAQVYMYVLYKEVKAKTKTETSSSLTWMWVLAGLGWALLLVGVIALVYFFPHFLQSLQNPFNKLPQRTV